MVSAGELRLHVLHGLRLKGFATPDAVAASIGVKAPAVSKELTALKAAGLVERREGRVSGFVLTDEGRSEASALVEAELVASGAKALLEETLHGFAPLNDELLEVCTAWQLRDVHRNIENDHSDAAYDREVIARLVAVNASVTPVLSTLKTALARFGSYQKRLDAAVAKVKRGERDWFAKPMIESYHTVWMELHEDLLVTLQIERVDD
jgi:DNA-binding MarR family transcriptional regulator